MLASLAMFAGIQQALSPVRLLLTGAILAGINAFILKGFRNVLPVTNYYLDPPWFHHVRVAAEGVIVLTVGTLLGLWAHIRNQRKPAP